MTEMKDITELPKVVPVEDQPCQQLYEGNPVLLGYDVVAYHFIPAYVDGGVAVRGTPEFAYNFEGYQFWFNSTEHRNLFISDPWKYAPAWGGFCSWGIALEKKPKWPWQPDFLGPPASPWEGWAIVDGLLTFNIWADYTRRFLLDQDTNMRLAKERWADMWGSDTGTIQVGPFNTHCIGHGPLKNWCLSQQPSPWLEALPECIDENNVGGGIVSQQDDFSEFSNSQKSPYQEKWLRAGAIGIPSFLAFLCFLVGCCRCFSRKQTTTEELDHVLAYNNDDDKNENGAAGSGSDRTSSDDEREPSSSIELARSMA